MFFRGVQPQDGGADLCLSDRHCAAPPLWALGYQQSRYSYETEAEARAVVNQLRADRIPTDALYLDIDYQDHNRPFTVSPTGYPDLPRFAADLKGIDMRLVLITDLHVAFAPQQGYAPYDSARRRTCS